MNFRFAGKKLPQHAPQAQRLFAESRPHPFIARGRGIALIEDQVDHREYGLNPATQLVPTRRLKGNVCFREGLLGARDPLAQRLFRHKKRTGDLRRGEAADQAQRKRDASFHRKHGMARGEDEPQHVIVDHLIQRLLQSVSKPLLLPLQLAGNFFMLLYEHVAAPERIDRAPLRRLHQPCRGIVRDAFLGPNFEGSHERILRQFLGNADIVGDAGNRGDEPCGLDLPHGLNRLRHICSCNLGYDPLGIKNHHETHELLLTVWFFKGPAAL